MASAVQVEPTFSGKTVLLTGATSGIGEASAIAFGRRGAHVLVCGRDEARGRKVSEKVVAAGGKATLLIADLNDHQATLDLAKRGLDAAGGRVDILINNAGGGGFTPSAAVSLSDYDRTYNLNARAPFFLTAAIAPTMVANGAGAIVNVSASSTIKGVSGLSLFAGAKGALEAMTRGWAAEYGPAGVRVNAINLGAVETPINAHIRDLIAGLMMTTPARRMGKAEEVAAAILFLSSPAASYINGVVLPVDGGFAIS